MKTEQIGALQETEARKVEVKFATARSIRALLDAAREKYGAEEWDDNCLQDEVLELVTEEAES
jgi:hypothetical protein